MEHYLRSVHGSPTLSMISAARGLSPADCESTFISFPVFFLFFSLLKVSKNFFNLKIQIKINSSSKNHFVVNVCTITEE